MVALAVSVFVDGTRYDAGTDHTAMPAAAVDQVRNPGAWVGGTAPALSAPVPAGRKDIKPADLSDPVRARAALGLSASAAVGVGATINVKDAPYGAKGDGTTDDTAAIAAAAAALPASGGVLLFPATSAFYSITAGYTFSAKSRLTIRGEAPGVEVRVAAATTDSRYNSWPNYGKDSIFRLLDCTDVLVENLKLNGNISNRTGFSGSESFNSCLLIAGSTRVTVRGCHLTEAMTDGVTVSYNQAGTLCTSIVIENNTISKCRRNNISLVGQNGCLVSGNRLLDAGTVQGVNPQSALDIEPDNLTGRSKNVRVVNNVVTGAAGAYAISCAGTGTESLTIAGNHIYDNVGNGLNLSVGSSGTNSQTSVTGNTITGHTGLNMAAIRVTGTACDVISGNTIAGNSYGVNGAGAVDGLLITGNKFTGNLYNAISMTSFVKVVCNGNLFTDNTSSAGDAAGAGFAWRGTPASVNAITIFNDNLMFTTAGASPVMSGARVDTTCNAISRANVAKNLKSSTIVRGFTDVGSIYVDNPVPQVPGANYLATGRYTGPASAARTTLQISADTEYAVPFYVGQATAKGIDRIGIEVTIAGTAGTLIRLGVRASDAAGLPAALTLDAGTVAGDAIATVELTVALTDVAPGLYWLTATSQSSGVTLPTVRAVNGNLAPISVTALATALGNINLTGYSSTATVTGALPASYPINSRVGAAPLVVVRGA